MVPAAIPPPPPRAVLGRQETIYQTKVATLSQQQARAVVKHFKERLAITMRGFGSGRNLTTVKAELSAKWPKDTPSVTVVVCP